MLTVFFLLSGVTFYFLQANYVNQLFICSCLCVDCEMLENREKKVSMNERVSPDPHMHIYVACSNYDNTK